MGGGRWNDDNWKGLSKSRSTQSRTEMFTKTAARQDYVPSSIKGSLRESVDSADNPNSTPIIIANDVTGSMGFIPQYMATTGVGEIMAKILKYQPVQDPHVLMATFADALGDYYPLQVAQFEADNRIAEQAVEFHLGGGGAQDSESYDYPWFFAAKMTKTDAWDKRGKKGYLFTTGDEPAPNRTYDAFTLQRTFGSKIATRAYTSAEMLDEARKRWSCFHIVIEEGARGRSRETERTWKEMMGPNVLFLDDHTKLADLIVATIAFAEGSTMEQVLEQAGDGRKSVERAFRMVQEFAG